MTQPRRAEGPLLTPASNQLEASTHGGPSGEELEDAFGRLGLAAVPAQRQTTMLTQTLSGVRAIRPGAMQSPTAKQP